jgi:hypothetical protein
MIVIEDNFYPNPDEVRENALKMFFHPGVRGKKLMFAGQRTFGVISEHNRLFCKNRISKLINRNIINFAHNNSNGGFTLGKEISSLGEPYKNWIHQDKGNHETERSKELQAQMFAAVCYLTPNDIAPSLKYGTALFTNLESGKNWATPGHNFSKTKIFQNQVDDSDKNFKLHTYVGNMYNRIVIYPATYWHAPFNPGFGYNKETGRLIQIFFFYAEKSGVNKGYEEK